MKTEKLIKSLENQFYSKLIKQEIKPKNLLEKTVIYWNQCGKIYTVQTWTRPEEEAPKCVDIKIFTNKGYTDTTESGLIDLLCIQFQFKFNF